MKRKIALMLAAVMTTAMLPMTAIASSTNTPNRVATVKENEVITDVKLKISPKDGVTSNSSINITIDGAEFDADKVYKKTGSTFEELTAYAGPGGETYDEVIAKMSRGGWTDATIKQTLLDVLGANTSALPYSIKITNKKEIQVKLSPLPDAAGDTANIVSTDGGKPYYLIPIVAVAKDDGDIKITVDSNESTISDSTHTIARSTSSKGATTTTVADVKTFSDTLYVDDITVKESVAGTFESGTVKVRVNGGFEIKNPENITITAGSNGDDSVYIGKKTSAVSSTATKVGSVTLDDSKSYITFEMPSEWTNTSKVASFVISGLEVEAEDEDKNWGDVNITVSGSDANITKETIKVGERVDYGFSMTVLDEVPTIISGRTYLVNSDLEEDDFESATVKFEETAANTWITTRKLQFTVPDGVKIIDVDYDEIEELNNLEEKSAITEDGTVLKVDKGIEFDNSDRSDEDDEASFEMNLYLSIDADYTGDVTLSVAGAGLAEDTLEDVVIANAVAPISIETSSTKVNMGYQVFDAADITITEAQDGVLLDEEDVVVSFDDSKFGNDELGFNDTDVEYTIDGELEIDNFEVRNGAITFDIDKTSYTEPSSITLSNITVGTTRSVPYGSYDLKVSGSAVINNYEDKVSDIYPVAYADIDKADDDIALFDTTDGYSFDKYVEIITEAGTLDGVVEVTIGEKTITVDGESVDMDVAAYIQTSSNSTMVPLRFVSLALGVDSDNVNSVDNTSKIAWDANSKTATILYAAGNGQKIIQFQAGSNYMVVDGTSIPMENGVVAEITDSRMFVPFRALGQALGVTVDWDAETRTAIYNKR
jgi:hypothetical protein